jgi:hypothetical protein
MTDAGFWVPDDWYHGCVVCDVGFTRTHRRHHCRSCGLIVCEECSQAKAIVPAAPVLLGSIDMVGPAKKDASAELKKPQRVCVACREVLDRVRSMLPANENPHSERRVFAYRSSMMSHLRWEVRHELYRLAVITGADRLDDRLSTGTGSPTGNEASAALLGIESSNNSGGMNPTSHGLRDAPAMPIDAATRRHRRFSQGPTMFNSSQFVDDSETIITGAHQALSASAHDRCMELQAKHQETLAKQEQFMALEVTLRRHSLTLFFHEVFSTLHTVLLSNVMSLRNEHYVQFGKTAPLEIHGVHCNAHVPVFTLNVLSVVGLRETAPAVDLCDQLAQLLIRAVLRLTLRYEEQIASLNEAGARALALTVLFRILAHASSIRVELSSLAAVQDFFAEAVLVQQPVELPLQTLTTRVRSLDTNWTDAGALQQCGVRTSDGSFYDSVAANKYYYRLGSAAEASALSLQKVVGRSSPSPLDSASTLLLQLDSFMRTRNRVLALYGSAHFAPPDQRSWAARETTSEAMQLKIAIDAVSIIRDFLTTRQRLLTMLTQQCHRANEELKDSHRRINEVTSRLMDFVTATSKAAGGTLPPELRRIRDAIDAVGSTTASHDDLNTLLDHQTTIISSPTQGQPNLTGSSFAGHTTSSSSEMRDYQVVLWNQFCDIVLSNEQASAVFYAHLRLKLSAVFLCAFAFSRVTEREHLMGNPVPPTRALRSIAESWVSTASQSDTMRTWSYADVIDSHCDLLARAVTERHRFQIKRLKDAGIIAFAECGAARLVWLAETQADVTHMLQWGKIGHAVRKMGYVDLGNTVVACSRVYLPQNTSIQLLREQYLYSKAGLRRNEDGALYVGTVVEARAQGKLPFHKPLKYGYLSVTGSEIARLTYLWTADNHGTALARASRRPAKGSKSRHDDATSPVMKGTSRTGGRGTGEERDTLALTIRDRESEELFHWPMSLVSCGPSPLSVNELIGVTVRMRRRDGTHVPATASDAVHFRVITHRQSAVTFTNDVSPLRRSRVGSEHDLTDAAASASAGAFLQVSSATLARAGSYSQLAIPRAGASDHTTTVRVTSAGVCVVGAIYNGWMVVSNLVRVRPSSASWSPDRSSVTVEPACCVAGGVMVARMCLRDAFGNIVASMDTQHLNVTITCEDAELAPSSLEQTSDGAIICTFRPVTAGTVTIQVVIGSYVLKYTQEVLRCIPGPTDFKNSVLSFDEYEVSPGVTVNGNLLLRDAYSNRILGDEKDFEIELHNGDRVVLRRVQIMDGEYTFCFQPLRCGTATVRAVSRKTGDFVAAKVSVVNATDVDWSKCVVACVAKEVFAGERATFHFAVKDSFGNAVGGLDRQTMKHRVYHPSSGTDVEVGPITGEAPTFTFTVVLQEATPAVAVIEVDGHSVMSEEVRVAPAALCWAKSKLQAPRTAMVGEWIPVQIYCCDRYGNLTPAQSGDFTVSAENEGHAGSAKTVEGYGSQFGFTFLGLHSGTSHATVTYAGHQEYVATVIMTPAAPSWAHSRFTSETHQLRAGEDFLNITINFCDQYGNRAFQIEPDRLKVRIDNEGETIEVLDVVQEAPPRTKDEVYADPLPTVPESRVVYRVKPTKTGHVQAFIRMDGEREEKAAPLVGVGPTIVSWEHCEWTFPETRAVAGVPLRARLVLVDRFGNPSVNFVDWDLRKRSARQQQQQEQAALVPAVEISNDVDAPAAESASDRSESPLQVELAADDAATTVITSGPSSQEAMDATLPPVLLRDVLRFIVEYTADGDGPLDERIALEHEQGPSPSAHVLIVQCIPKRACTVQFTVRATCPEAITPYAPDVVRDLDHTKAVEIRVEHSDLDWQFGTVVEHAETTVAGDVLWTMARLYDTYGNAIPIEHALYLLDRPSDTARSITAYDENPPTTLKKHFKGRLVDAKGTAIEGSPVARWEDAASTCPQALKSNQIAFAFVPQAAGTASISLSCNDKMKQSTNATVTPAVFHWPSTTTRWESSAVFAGLPGECYVELRDRFGNIACDRPALELLNADCTSGPAGERADVTVLPSFDLRGTQVVCSFMSEHIGTFTLVFKLRDDEATIATATSILVEAGEVYWPNVQLNALSYHNNADAAATPQQQSNDNLTDVVSESIDHGSPVSPSPSSPGGSAASANRASYRVMAGEVQKFFIALRDRFGNPAWRGVPQADLITAISGRANALGKPIEVMLEAAKLCDQHLSPVGSQSQLLSSAQPPQTGVQPRVVSWVASSTITRTGDYVLSVRTPRDEPKEITFRVTPAPVQWPEGVEWTSDGPQVDAGADLFFLLETKDRYANPSSVGITPVGQCLSVSMLLQTAEGAKTPPDATDNGDGSFVVATGLQLLPQPDEGSFGLHFATSTAGRLWPVVSIGTDPSKVKCDPVRVTAAEPAWQGSELVPPAGPCAAGSEIGVEVALCDRFNNRLPAERGAEEGSLVVARAAFADGPSTVPVPVKIASVHAGRPGLWILVQPTKAGLLDVSCNHADSTTALTAQVLICPGALARSTAVLTLPPTLVAGTEISVEIILADEYGNRMINTKADDFTVTAEPQTTPTRKPITMHVASALDDAGRTTRSGIFVATCVLTAACETVVTVACSNPTAPNERVTLGTGSVRVLAASASATRSTIAIDSRQGVPDAVAGETFTFLLALADAYGNVISEFPSTARIGCINGGATPRMTTAPTKSADGEGRFTITIAPTQAGSVKVDLHLLDGTAAGTVSSPSVQVAPAPLHWPSCGIKLVEDRVSVGHDTAVIVMPKDRFGNPVEATASEFTAVMELLDVAEAPLPDDQQPKVTVPFGGSRTLTAQVVPTVPGRARIKVLHSGDLAHPRYSSVILSE